MQPLRYFFSGFIVIFYSHVSITEIEVAEVFWRCSINKTVLQNFAKLTGKHLRWSLFFNRVAGLRLATKIKKRLRHKRFPVSFAKFLRTPFLENLSRRLLLELCLFIRKQQRRIQHTVKHHVNYYQKQFKDSSQQAPSQMCDWVLNKLLYQVNTFSKSTLKVLKQHTQPQLQCLYE